MEEQTNTKKRQEKSLLRLRHKFVVLSRLKPYLVYSRKEKRYIVPKYEKL